MKNNLPQIVTGDFPHAPEELSAFAYTFDIFVISLKNGSIIRYQALDYKTFYGWLIINGVRDIDKYKIKTA